MRVFKLIPLITLMACSHEGIDPEGPPLPPLVPPEIVQPQPYSEPIPPELQDEVESEAQAQVVEPVPPLPPEPVPVEVVVDTPEQLPVVEVPTETPAQPVAPLLTLPTPQPTFTYVVSEYWEVNYANRPQLCRHYEGTLTWEPVTGAHSYTVQIDDTWAGDTSDTTAWLKLSSIPGGVYVTAWDSEGNESERGLATWELTGVTSE